MSLKDLSINVSLEIENKDQLDECVKKAQQLVELLKEAQKIINELK